MRNFFSNVANIISLLFKYRVYGIGQILALFLVSATYAALQALSILLFGLLSSKTLDASPIEDTSAIVLFFSSLPLSVTQLLIAWLAVLALSSLFSPFLSYITYHLAYLGGNSLSVSLLTQLHYQDYQYFKSVSPKTFLNLLVYSNNILVRQAIFPILSLPYSILTIFISILVSASFLSSSLLVFLLPFLLIIPITRTLYFFQVRRSSQGYKYENSLTADVSRLTDSTYEFLTARFLSKLKLAFSSHISLYRRLLVFQSLTPRLIKSSLEFLVVISSVIFVVLSLYRGVNILAVTTELVTVFFATYKILPAINTLTSLHQSIGSSSEIIKQYSAYLLYSQTGYLRTTTYTLTTGKELAFSVDRLLSDSFSNDIQPLSFTHTIQDGIFWIIGPSGSGKSTLLSIFAGFLYPSSGTHTLSVTDHYLRHLTEPYSYQSCISFVPQYPSAINSTLYDFATDGSQHTYSYEIFMSILDRIGVLRQISQSSSNPISPSLLLGTGGYHLSGGQNKLLHLSRALSYVDAPLIFLDEPTSGVSSDLIQPVLHEIRRASQRSLLIIVTHDLSFIQDSDRVLTCK